MKRVKHVLILLCLCLYAGVSQAQVTIGANEPPNTFSVLELISNQKRGLRLPQLTTAKRDVLDFADLKETEAKGLMIYNTDIDCVETWNGTDWISSCACEPTTSLTIKANTNWQQHRSGASFVFKAKADGSTDALVIDWYADSQIAGTTTGNNLFFYNPTKFGRYVVQAKVRESCSTVSVIESNLDTVIVGCGAYTAANSWLVFMCHNLGADRSLDPFIPAAGLHGAKYRFGAKEASLSMSEDQDKEDKIPDWKSFPFQNNNDDWSIDNNPCPTGWRLPTITEWTGVKNADFNARTTVGDNWGASPTNFTTGMKFGIALFLPATGSRYFSNGTLDYRGYYGYYWSSSRYILSGDYYGQHMYISSGGASTGFRVRSYGSSVRCVAD